MKKTVSLSLFFFFFLQAVISQNTGIGTITPSEKLEVAGNIKTDTLKAGSLKITNNAGTGKVLTSDATGVASWQNTGATVKAVNGLSRSADSVMLGGVMNDGTRLRLNGNSFTFRDTGSIALLSFEQTGFTNAVSLSTIPVTQTFTAVSDGSLSALRLYVAAFGGSSITVRIKDASLAIIDATTNNYGAIFNDWDSFSFSEVLLTAGEVYTIELTCTGTTQIHYENTNPYAGGASSIGASADIAFRVFTITEKNLLHLSGNRVGINTTTPAASLDINGTLKITDGSEGTGKLFVSDAAGKGSWQTTPATTLGGWGTTGNTGITTANFIGTTDNQPLLVKTNGIQSGKIDHANRNYFIGQNAGLNASTVSGQVAIGHAALQLNQIGLGNTAVGDSVLSATTNEGVYNTGIGRNAITKNTTGVSNTAVGARTLYNSVTGSFNTAIGYAALYSNIGGNDNIAVGNGALYKNTEGVDNIAMGLHAAYFNTTGSHNVAIGTGSLVANTTGSRNVAMGTYALKDNLESNNVAIGYGSSISNTTGSPNTAVGTYSLFSNQTGNENTAIGFETLSSNTTGSGNTAIGHLSLRISQSAFSNTGVGSATLMSNTTGVENTAVGYNALQGNTFGAANTGVGVAALYSNSSAINNTAIGFQALQLNNDQDNTAIGYRAGALAMGVKNCTFLGTTAGTNIFGIQNAAAIGSGASVTQSNSMVFGNNIVTKWGFGINPGAANIIEFANTTARLTTGGSWTNASDRNLKANVIPVDSREILNRIMLLPVSRWNYKSEDAGITHIGPMAQDFYQLFATGSDDKTISSIDPSGVALAGIQQLKKEIDELKKTVALQQKQIERLQKK